MRKVTPGFLLLLIFIIFSLTSEEQRPKEGIRVFSTDVSGMYFPSFITTFGGSKSVLPFHDNFAASLKLSNLIKKGPNLHLSFGVNHLITSASLMPETDGELTISDSAEQETGTASAAASFTFLDFFTLVPGVQYTQNRTVSSDTLFSDYNFDELKGSLEIAYEARYSTLEQWYLGAIPLYPNRGFMAAAGSTYRYIDETLTDGTHGIMSMTGKFQYLIGLHEFITLSLHGAAAANLEKTDHRIAKTTVQIIGSYPAVGDYSGDAHLELRFLHPAGLSLLTPSFLIARQLFKLSPGVVLGYNAGAAGSYDGSALTFIQSGYISPVVAIRWNGNLIMVFRFDIAFASRRKGGVFSINFGTINADRLGKIWGTDI